MCYDRYVSICKPLHYGTLLGSRACAHMAAAAWASAFLNALMHTANTFPLPLCHGNALGQFFCEIPHILKLSCTFYKLRELGLIAVSACLAFGCFVFIVFSYVQIFRAVLRILSEQGRHKAFSTCLPHLAVVSLYISTGTFAHLKPPSMSSSSLELALSVLYLVVPPALNSLIYSLRNQELKAAVRLLLALPHYSRAQAMLDVLRAGPKLSHTFPVLWDQVTLTCQGLGTTGATTWYKDGRRWWQERHDCLNVTESGTYECDRPGIGLSPTVTVLDGEGGS
ncbi:olfactory receptor 14J1-like [Haemorhous mexicanus]|uniref:olfactory receptor 14J1-like n=1 Tax=Haemorhous mexicanus TaxID=30427 RepID=UPI0028BE976C|nr:olfactory receptor 14J1-like [Haemorhous mexicanus]